MKLCTFPGMLPVHHSVPPCVQLASFNVQTPLFPVATLLELQNGLSQCWVHSLLVSIFVQYSSLRAVSKTEVLVQGIRQLLKLLPDVGVLTGEESYKQQKHTAVKQCPLSFISQQCHRATTHFQADEGEPSQCLPRMACSSPPINFSTSSALLSCLELGPALERMYLTIPSEKTIGNPSVISSVQ